MNQADPPRIHPLHGLRKVTERIPRDQLDLFRQQATIHRLPTRVSLFERALMLDAKNSELAESAYLRAIEAGDNVASAYCNLAVLRFDAGDRDSSIALLSRALAEDRDHAESHFNLGNIYLEEGWLRPAEVHFELALAIDPDMTEALFNLAVARLLQDRIPEAIDTLELYREICPGPDADKATEILRLLQGSFSEPAKTTGDKQRR